MGVLESADVRQRKGGGAEPCLGDFRSLFSIRREEGGAESVDEDRCR